MTNLPGSFSDLNEGELELLFQKLTRAEMLVLIKSLAQAIGSNQVDLNQPALLELQAGIIDKYGSLANFARAFPLQPSDVPVIKAIVDKLTLITAKRG